MKYLLCVALLVLSACSGVNVRGYDLHHGVVKSDGDANYVTSEPLDARFKTVEIYEQNAFAPSYQYVMLFQCETKEGKEHCEYLGIPPTSSPGMVAGLIAPVIQAGAIVGGAALIGSGIRDGKSTTNVANGSNATANGTSNVNASASSSSSSTSTSSSSTGSVNAVGGNINGGIHY